MAVKLFVKPSALERIAYVRGPVNERLTLNFKPVKLMDDEACFCVVFPLAREEELLTALREHKLFLNRWRKLRGWSSIEAKQGLYCFTHWTGKEALREADVVLREGR